MGRDEGGKTDMERVGLFSEVGYTTIGDKYPKVGNGLDHILSAFSACWIYI